jgi:hypothetical protein
MQNKDDAMTSISEYLYQSQKVNNAIGEAIHDNLNDETGKLRMQFVAADQINEHNIQKKLIHHGANSMSMYQYYHHKNRNKNSKSTTKMQTPQDWQARKLIAQPQSQLIKNLVSRKATAHPVYPK